MEENQLGSLEETGSSMGCDSMLNWADQKRDRLGEHRTGGSGKSKAVRK